MARQYTTPQIDLHIDGHDLSGADDVYVTFANKARNAEVTFDSPTVTTDSTGTTVSVHFTQAQAGVFWFGEDISVQVNWMDSGERIATDIAVIPWKENLIKEVLV